MCKYTAGSKVTDGCFRISKRFNAVSTEKKQTKKSLSKSWTLFFPLPIHSSVALVTVTDGESQVRVNEG